MNRNRLVLREILHRKTNFILAVLAIALAVGCVLGTLAAVRSHDLHADQMIAGMESETQAQMKKLEDDIRKTMKGLGFNIYIFPEDQDLSEVYDRGFASKTMPEEYVTQLANSKIVTVNHLLPSLTQKLEWPERKRTVILIGIRGEVPIAHRDPKKPLIDPVAEGELVLGYELHHSLGIQTGDTIPFMNREFKVRETYPERGSKDDITIWMNLAQCQELLDQPGRINAIQALECNCASLDRLGAIRKELMQILPKTKIIETQSSALARAEARNKAKAVAKKQIASAKENRDRMSRSRKKFAGILLPIALLGSMAWVSMLTLMNVRDRVSEIGVLRAIGVNSNTILTTFLMRAAIAGVVGTLLGMAVFAVVYRMVNASVFDQVPLGDAVPLSRWGILLFAAPLLAAASAWLPSLLAAQKDPAEVLRHD